MLFEHKNPLASLSPRRLLAVHWFVHIVRSCRLGSQQFCEVRVLPTYRLNVGMDGHHQYLCLLGQRQVSAVVGQQRDIDRLAKLLGKPEGLAGGD